MTDNRTAALMFFLACVTLAFCVVQARGCIENQRGDDIAWRACERLEERLMNAEHR